MDTESVGTRAGEQPQQQSGSRVAVIGTIVVALIGAVSAITVAAIASSDGGTDDTITGTSTEPTTDATEPTTTATTSPPPQDLATITCPTTGAGFGTEAPLVRGTADLAHLDAGQELWLFAWSESPEGRGFAGYPHSRITADEWQVENVTIASPDEPEGPVELRIYAVTVDQGRQIDAEYAANVPLVYLAERELPTEPEARVSVTRNAVSRSSGSC